MAAIQQINPRLNEIKNEVASDFPLNEAEIVAMRENLQAHVLKIHDLERFDLFLGLSVVAQR